MSHRQGVLFHVCPFAISQFGVVNGFQTVGGNKIKLLEAKYKPPGASEWRQERLRMTVWNTPPGPHQNPHLSMAMFYIYSNGTGGAEQLSTPALTEDPSLIPSTHAGQLTTAANSSSRESTVSGHHQNQH